MIGDRVFREITDNVWDPLQRIEECDRDGVSMQVLSTVPVMFSYWAKPADALDLSRRLNDHIAEVVRAHPKRFAGLGTIPMQDPDLAAGELERCIRELGLRGAEIGTHVDANPHSGRIDPLNLDNASLQPVWSAAEKLNAAIFVHPWDMVGKERMPSTGYRGLLACRLKPRWRFARWSLAVFLSAFPSFASLSPMVAEHFRLPLVGSSARFTCGPTWSPWKTVQIHAHIWLAARSPRGSMSIHLSTTTMHWTFW